MKIIFLNAWNGKVKNEIEKFIIEQSGDTDIFCFQEVYDDMREISQRLLPNYKELAANKHVNTYNLDKKAERSDNPNEPSALISYFVS